MANKLHIVRLLIVFSYLIISNISLPLHAQFVEPKFDKIIPVLISNCVLQDSYGFIWIGDQGGLIKFDGYELKRYTHEPNKLNKLSYNCVNDIIRPLIIDTNAEWIATGNGLNRLDLNTETFTHIKAEGWSARGGYWDFSGKVIKAKGFIGYNKAYYNRKVFADFIYEVKLCKTAEDGTFGLLFRYDEKNDEGYLLQFWPHGGCSFELIKGGQTHIRQIEIRQPMHQIIGTNVWNKVKIIANGSTFKIYLNGYLLDTIIDHQYALGRVGLFVAGDPRQIALFEVTTIKVP